MGRPLPSWTHPPAYAAARLAALGVNLCDLDSVAALMRAGGRAFGRLRFNRARLERARRNIAWCFPEWSDERVAACADSGYEHLATLATEVVAAARFLTTDGWATRVEVGDLKSGLRAMTGDRPCLLITGHCGNWEILGSVLGLLGFPINALYRPFDIARLDSWVKRTRAQHGLTLVDKFGAAHTLPAALDRGEAVAFVADQNAGRKGVFVPFMGRLASAYKTIGLLATHRETPIVCGMARRLRPAGEGPLRYRIEIVDVFGPEDWADAPDPVYYITARYRRAIETMVRRAPEQYLWMHRYWKTRPPHERAGRPFPPSLRERIASLPWMTDAELERVVERSARDAAEVSGAPFAAHPPPPHTRAL